jgi:SET domain-containing protein
MKDVVIGKGKLAGKGVYAARDFKKGELVISYNLKSLTQDEFDLLPKSEQMFVHSFWSKMYLFPEPSRYTNHSAKPNTVSDLDKMCDYALRPIRKNEMITTNATQEVCNELETFVEAHEKIKPTNFKWLKGGYRNVVISYSTTNNTRKTLQLQRIKGNWHIVGVQK